MSDQQVELVQMYPATPADTGTDESAAQTYHSSYSSPDASLILCSSDGVKFRVHLLIIGIASEVFNNMINGAEDIGEPVHLEEKSEVLEILLNMFYPSGPYFNFSGKDFDFIWDVPIAAEKYDLKQTLDEFRVRLSSESFFLERPIEAYAFAARFGWRQEIAITSRKALDLIGTANSWKALRRLDTRSALKLLELPSIRKAYFMKKFREKMAEIHGDSYLSTPSLQNLQCLVEHEFTTRPSGDTLRDHFWSQPMIAQSWLIMRYYVFGILQDPSLLWSVQI